MTLRARLQGIDPARRAVTTPAQSLTFGALCTAGRLRHRGGDPAQKLIVPPAEPAAAIRTLIDADGRAGAILLLPASLHGPGRNTAVATAEAALSAGLPMGAPGTAWILATSGTTGRPKLVRHDLASLTRTTRPEPDRGAGQVWGLMYDPARFAGMQVILQSLLSGAHLVIPDRAAPLADQLALLAAQGCTHLSATPTLWRRILMTPRATDLRLHQVTLGGEIADDAVLASLARAFPHARITHVFASTEAGAAFSVSDGRAGFPARYLEDPPAGIALRLHDGRLWVRNDLVGPTYVGTTTTLAHAGWVDTGDRVTVDGDRIHFAGRESGMINVGGTEVLPEQVESELTAHPQVALARVYGRANPITGAIVMADIVPASGAPETVAADVLAHLRQRLDPHMVPAVVRVVPDIAVSDAAKISRAE